MKTERTPLIPQPWAQGRLLYLVRHGHYDTGDGPGAGRLTPLGRKQARRLARYFEGHPIDRIFSSDVPRAVETAEILAEKLGFDAVTRRRVLREVLPARIPNMHIPAKKRTEGRQRIEAIVTGFFKASTTTRREIVVCHGNLIRSLVCRIAGAPLGQFTQLLAHHTGVTCFMVTPNGVRLVAYNVIDHLPAVMQSHS